MRKRTRLLTGYKDAKGAPGNRERLSATKTECADYLPDLLGLGAL